MNNVIPTMTNSLGKHWNQPPSEEILIDDTHALMSDEHWNQLPEYSFSIPTGVYAGKMWKVVYENEGYLMWFSDSEKEGFCDSHQRIVLIISSTKE